MCLSLLSVLDRAAASCSQAYFLLNSEQWAFLAGGQLLQTHPGSFCPTALWALTVLCHQPMGGEMKCGETTNAFKNFWPESATCHSVHMQCPNGGGQVGLGNSLSLGSSFCDIWAGPGVQTVFSQPSVVSDGLYCLQHNSVLHTLSASVWFTREV